MEPINYMEAIYSAVSETFPLFENVKEFSIWSKKNDQGYDEPVTSIDMEVHKIIKHNLKKYFPNATLLSEEGEKADDLGDELTFILDPIDGTCEFIRGEQHYSISLAVSENRQIIAGVVAYPAMGKVLRAAKGEGAWDGMFPIIIDQPSLPKISLAVSPREVGSEQMYRLQEYCSEVELIPIPALTPKVGAVLQGRVDAALYLGLRGVAHLWDYAAIGLIASEAGVHFTDLNGNNLLDDLPLINTRGWIVCSNNVFRYLFQAINDWRS